MLALLPLLTAPACDAQTVTTADRTTKPSATAQTAAAADLAGKRIIPWIEVNSIRTRMTDIDRDAFRDDDRTLIDHAARGIERWARVTDTVIVTTRPESVSRIYRALMARRPRGLKLIGGFKTLVLPGAQKADTRPYDFADPATWRELAAKAEEVARLTGVRVVVLENETALQKFHTGQGDIDLAKLEAALKPLAETGLQFWWALPAVLQDSRREPNRRKLTEQLVKTVARAVPESVFLTTHNGWHASRTDPGAARRRQTMARIVGPDRLIDMLYVQPDGLVHYSTLKKKRCYTPAEAVQELIRRSGNTVVVYPSAAKWILVADRFAELLAAERQNSAGLPK